MNSRHAGWWLLGVLALMLASVAAALAQNPAPVFTFDTQASMVAWNISWGTPQPVVAWDGGQDGASNALSGSLKVRESFTGALNEFFAVNGQFLDSSNQPVLVDPYQYRYLEFDLKVAPGTAPDTNGTFGYLEAGEILPSWGHTAILSQLLPVSATNWTHFRCPIPAPGLDLLPAAGVYLQVGSWLGNLTNALTVNIDNIGFGGGGPCCAPPRFWLERATTGDGYWLKWSVTLVNCVVQSCTDLAAGNWCNTGLETNAIPVGGAIGVPLPVTPEPARFWRLSLEAN